MTVDQCLTQYGYNVVTNPHHSLEKILKKTDYLEEDSKKKSSGFGEN